MGYKDKKRKAMIKAKEDWNKIFEEYADTGRRQERERILKLIDEAKIISENSYGEDDGTDEIILIKYLIDKEELKQKIKEEKCGT